MTPPVVAFATSILQILASARPLLSAIRVGSNRHITGLVCPDDTILTAHQVLPALDSYTVVLPNRVLLVARPQPSAPAVPQSASVSPGRGWFGAGLQPVTVPDVLVCRTGQFSGRHALRALPGRGWIGTTVEVKRLRVGRMVTRLLTIAAQPV